MLEYLTYKKVKKNRQDKADKQRLEKEKEEIKQAATPSNPVASKTGDPNGTPLLDNDDEKFLERLTSLDATDDDNDDDGPPPPLPPRVSTPVITWDSDTDSYRSQSEYATEGKGKGKPTLTKEKEKCRKSDDKKGNRFFALTNIGRSISLRKKSTDKSGLQPTNLAVPVREERKEEMEISQVLDDLDLSAQNNKVFSLSAESTEMVRKFTLVFKDLVNGVPTAYNDLVTLIEDRDGILAKNYEKLPKSLKKLVTTLPNKLTTTLAPELLAVAAEAQGLNAAEASKGGLKGAAKNFMTPKNLQEIVTKPGAVVGLLKGIVNALKTRWPAFIGTNVLWSVAIFLLLSVLWYCHKRGREERLLVEAAAKEDPINGATRVEELPDDPMLPASGPSGIDGLTSPDIQVEGVKLPPPPVGQYAEKASAAPSGSSKSRK